MKLLVLAVLCVASLAYADGTPNKFEFSAPAWPRNSDAELASRGSLGATVADGDLFVYTSANDEIFATYYLSDVGARDNPRDRITAFNRGVLAGASEKGQTIDPAVRSEGESAMTLQQKYALPGRAMELRVITTVDSAGILHAAFGLCAYPTTITEPG